MKTKQAIDFINEMRDIDITCTENDYDKHIEMINEVIDLLKHGEKYEEMWGKLDTTFSDGCFEDIRDIYHHIEQKYFPKE